MQTQQQPLPMQNLQQQQFQQLSQQRQRQVLHQHSVAAGIAQPNFSKAEAAQYEQPTAGWVPRVQGRKPFLRRHHAAARRFERRNYDNVASRIPLRSLRASRNAIGEMHPPTREKGNRSCAWTVDVSDCLFVQKETVGAKESTGHKLKRKARKLIGKIIPGAAPKKTETKAAIGAAPYRPLTQGQSMFSEKNAAQYEQPAAGWVAHVHERKPFLHRRPATQWHFRPRRHVVSRLPMHELRLRRNAAWIAPAPLEKKRGIAWSIDISDCLFKRTKDETVGHKLKRKAKEFVKAVKHIGGHSKSSSKHLPTTVEASMQPPAVTAQLYPNAVGYQQPQTLQQPQPLLHQQQQPLQQQQQQQQFGQFQQPIVQPVAVAPTKIGTLPASDQDQTIQHERLTG